MSSFKIAIIEDDIVDVRVYKKIISSIYPNCEIETFVSYKDVYGRILKFKPDIMLLDFNLGDSDAFHVIDYIKPKLFDIPIIVITGNDDKVIVSRLYDAGIYNYINKSNVDDVLPNVLNNAVSQYDLNSNIRLLNRQLTLNKVQFKVYALLYLIITAFILYLIVK